MATWAFSRSVGSAEASASSGIKTAIRLSLQRRKRTFRTFIFAHDRKTLASARSSLTSSRTRLDSATLWDLKLTLIMCQSQRKKESRERSRIEHVMMECLLDLLGRFDLRNLLKIPRKYQKSLKALGKFWVLSMKDFKNRGLTFWFSFIFL